ncbi:protein S40-5 [Vicia villosa]|uniref:protein S40-5 n=1 Tax=Vicia villosa TaxID=3911 RepID=UPI00273AE20F|nr:protein S40-5 [Vicia villosa]
MAKGRKLTTSQSERFLGTYGYSHNQGSTAADPSELREEDIWSTGGDTGEHEHDLNFSDEWESSNTDTVVSNGGSSYRDRRRITQNGGENRQLGGLSLAFEDPADDNSATATARIVHQFRAHESVASSPRGRHMATSLPVNVPDWSKILRVDSVESLHDDSLDDDDDLGMVPPHEYLARSRKTAAKSVFEGVGRTLKGRDLSRVRDAVWSQTGFDG